MTEDSTPPDQPDQPEDGPEEGETEEDELESARDADPAQTQGLANAYLALGGVTLPDGVTRNLADSLRGLMGEQTSKIAELAAQLNLPTLSLAEQTSSLFESLPQHTLSAYEAPEFDLAEVGVSPAVTAAVEAAETMRKLEELMVRQLQIAQAAEAANAEAARFTRRTTIASVVLSSASLVAALASIVVAVIALASGR